MTAHSIESYQWSLHISWQQCTSWTHVQMQIIALTWWWRHLSCNANLGARTVVCLQLHLRTMPQEEMTSAVWPLIRQMWRHLVTCFLNGKLSPFPRLHDLPQRSRKERSDIKIKLFCKCFMPDTWDKDMIMCDSCDEWSHFKCIDSEVPSEQEQWFCSDCA